MPETTACCCLCGRRVDPALVDHVDVMGGAAAVAVCHPCLLTLEREEANAVADAARDAWIAALEADMELAGPLPTEGDWSPVNDAFDAGEAA